MSETLLDTFSGSVAHLLRLGLSNAAATALLAMLVAGITLPLRRRRPAVVHALWLLVLLKLVTPPLWTIPVQWQTKAQPEQPAVSAPPAEVPSDLFVDVEELPVEPVDAPAPAAVKAPTVDWREVGIAAFGIVWLAGSAACGMLFVVRSLQFRRLLRNANPAPADVVRQVRRIGLKLGVDRCPSTWLIPGSVCPMLYAAGRPQLLLPRGLWDRLDDDQRDTLIAHELAHLRRRDHWVRYVEVAATALYWWFPVLWWARRELREAEEQCCDAWVVWSMPSAVRDYMSAILAAVDFVSQPETHNAPFAPPAVPALASGMGEFRRLERRLWMIRANKSPHRLSRAAVLAVLLGAAALPLAPTLAGEDEKGATASRDVVVTQTEPSTDIRFDTSDLRIDTDATISFSPDVQGVVVEGGDIKVAQPDHVITERFVDSRTGNVVETRGQSLTIVAGSDLDQARAAVDQARVNLKMAEARLKQLEAEAKGRAKGDKGDKPAEKSFRYGIVGKSADKPTPKMNSIKGRIVEEKGFNFSKGDVDPTAAKGGDRDQDKRMEKLERKLDALMDELREIKKEGSDRKDSAAGPGERH